MNKSLRKCCICNNEKTGEFIIIDNEKYHLCCIKQLKEVINKVNKLINHYLKNIDESGSYVETNTGWKLIPEILKELKKILNEVSE